MPCRRTRPAGASGYDDDGVGPSHACAAESAPLQRRRRICLDELQRLNEYVHDQIRIAVGVHVLDVRIGDGVVFRNGVLGLSC
jgi:hypothetical protein